jgi:hypothetical protein
MERDVAINSGMLVRAKRKGTVTYVDADRIEISNEDVYHLRKYTGLNERTCLNQKPIVEMGQKVEKGQVLADGANFGDGNTVPVFVASDSERAKQTAIALAESIGFRAVDAGGLKNARYLEPLAGLNIYLGYGAGLGTAITPTWIARA